MRFYAVFVAALLVSGCGVLSEGEYFRDKAAASQDAGGNIDNDGNGATDDAEANTDAGSKEDATGKKDDPRMKNGAWCPGMGCTLRPTPGTDGETWDCLPIMGELPAELIPDACWNQEDSD